MNTIHFIGVSNGLKPRYILEEFFKCKTNIRNKEFYFITNDTNTDGMVLDFCKENNINVLKVDMDNTECAINTVQKTHPEILISIGWSQKIPEDFLAIFQFAINCHGGLLPDYRGNNVYMHNYANLSEYYGTTIHYMNNKFDDGNIILQARAKLFLEETPLIIHRRICEMTAQILPEAIRLVEQGYAGEKQKGIARYFYKMNRIEMENLRQKNIENIRKGEKIQFGRYKEWKVQ